VSEANNQVLIEKIYAEILSMKKELHEIKTTIIHEDEPEEDEVEAIRMVQEDRAAGNYRPWRELKKELGGA